MKQFDAMTNNKITERDQNGNSAIDVYAEAATIYWQSIRDNKGLAGRMSIHQLRQLFDLAVIPSIKEVRRLDRQYDPILTIKVETK